MFRFRLGPVDMGSPDGLKLEPARACVRAGLGLTTPNEAPEEWPTPPPDAELDRPSSARDVGYGVGEVVSASVELEAVVRVGLCAGVWVTVARVEVEVVVVQVVSEVCVCPCAMASLGIVTT